MKRSLVTGENAGIQFVKDAMSEHTCLFVDELTIETYNAKESILYYNGKDRPNIEYLVGYANGSYTTWECQECKDKHEGST